jgi:precorrin-2 dehydrogenase/sirohydrochlorin ferrochelatase
MVPILLDPASLRVAIVGQGAKALGRLQLLRRHGAEPLAVFAPDPSATLAAEAGALLRRHWPQAADFARLHLVLASSLEPDVAESLAALARAAKVLINVEDVPALSDVHIPATVRRGDLLLTASTGGRAPGLSRRLAGWLSERFGTEWAGRLDELATQRSALRAEGLSGVALAQRVERLLDEKGWLS